jgi:formamidopyrimidine-DNA glycosylase
MPELPEVETIRRQLEPVLRDRRVRSVRLVDAPAGPKYAGLARAPGARIVAVDRRGKFLLLPLSNGDELVIHLGMTGSLATEEPADHVRVVLELAGPGPRRLYFRDPRRFGRMLVLPGGERSRLPTLAHMGPEPLGEELTAATFHQALQHSTALKPLLLSQRPVAGLGNIYADEALWRAQVHPRLPARRLSRRSAGRLLTAIRAVLGEAIERKGTTLSDYRTLDGGTGEFGDALAVYGRAGEPCPRCRAPIARFVLAARSTHYCPRCQRPPAAPSLTRSPS